ncbi:Aminofutalosine synthase MqnE [Candidatus Desulfarcum epimagneticum]|uniref:Aminofutalosine synthase MqnE n=1 Tax=uncultured Desulfobacteraceae bacterium TaxID=218296 RepID=A0A484HG51_9BACT|nr:Aminofutalosine synthase MqnE [uncultured Desulfobacteraceae bacterium]
MTKHTPPAQTPSSRKLPDRIDSPGLKDIAAKVDAGVPVSRKDAAVMLKTHDILDLGIIADHIRTRLYGKSTFYSVNMNLNYTNVCELRCPLCAYSCDKDDENAFVLSLDEIENRMTRAAPLEIDEVHIVGGLNPDIEPDYYENMLRLIKKIRPDIHIVAFTAAEYDYFAKRNGLSLKEIFARFMDSGLGALPGGGAEIFAERVREKIAPKKISGDRWLEVMAAAHESGLKANATMLYNHIENDDDIIDHLSRLRDFQDKTPVFKTFLPLLFHRENTEIKSRKDATGFDDIRIYATSRIFLHNFPHIKALWMYLGEKTAQILQAFGVDDLGGTYHNEKVVHAAGADTSDFGTESFMRRLISRAGFEPRRTAADYRERKNP